MKTLKQRKAEKEELNQAIIKAWMQKIVDNARANNPDFDEDWKPIEFDDLIPIEEAVRLGYITEEEAREGGADG